MKKILIPYACGEGAKDVRCADAPANLKRMGLGKHLGAKWASEYKSEKIGKFEIIKDSCTKLSDDVIKVIEKGGFPITIGGDHSMAMGTWSGVTTALNMQGNFGLIWFDAHMDAHTPQTSDSGAYHGMPLAHLLGYGDEELCSIGSNMPKISPHHLCLIGIRSYEEKEANLLQKLGVRIFYIDEVKKRGLNDVVNEALQIVKKNTDGYGITIDVDAFDPDEAPGTGTIEPDGLHREDAVKAFSLFKDDSDLKALELAEYNKHLDKKSITSKLIFDVLGTTLNK
jgi:arginase